MILKDERDMPGVTPSGTGYSAEPGPISVVPAVPVSIPNAIRAEYDRAIAERSELLEELARVDRKLRQCFAAGAVFDLDLPSAPKNRAETVSALVAGVLAAAPKGLAVTEIRPPVEAAYGRPLHAKSIGVALLRMSKNGTAKRSGRKWFAQ